MPALLLRLLLLLWRNSGGNRSSRPPTPMTRVTPAPAPAATDLRGRFRQCSSPSPLNLLTDGRQTGWSQATRSRAGEYEERGGAVSSSYVRTGWYTDDRSWCTNFSFFPFPLPRKKTKEEEHVSASISAFLSVDFLMTYRRHAV